MKSSIIRGLAPEAVMSQWFMTLPLGCPGEGGGAPPPWRPLPWHLLHGGNFAVNCPPFLWESPESPFWIFLETAELEVIVLFLLWSLP